MKSTIRLNRPAEFIFKFSTFNSPFLTRFIILPVFLLFLVPAAVFADIIHIPADFADIQAAIDDPNTDAGDEIVVAPGHYLLTSTIDFNGKAITLCSTDPNDPNIVAATILDGQGNDGDPNNDVYHVIQCISGEDPNTILSGFTITGGKANSTHVPDALGGGMSNVNSSPSVTHCIFEGNSAESGGGMSNSNSNPTVTSCTFRTNASSSDAGGGMYNYLSSPTMAGCTFYGNSAASGGGGMCNVNSGPAVTSCLFIDNTTDGAGGGMYNSGYNPTVTNCTFSGNTAAHGGAGMINRPNTNQIVAGCTFDSNTTDGKGGGMLNNDSNTNVTNCIFRRNRSLGIGGGGMFNYSGNLAVTNCIFIRNEAADDGGGMLNDMCSPAVTNCTFVANTSTDKGGGMDNHSSTPTVTNCIFWGNSLVQFSNAEGAVVTISYCDIAGGLPADSMDGGGNIDADPLFVDADGLDHIAGTEDDDLRLLPGSLCIDAGTNAIPPGIETDLDGNTRVQNVAVDMGAYEYGDDCDDNGMPDYLQFDADGDGYIDECDLCPGFNDHLDADGDGVPDDCDICLGFDDAADGDDDGAPNGCDICPGSDDNADTDGDGVPDGCDQCPGFDDAMDADGDSIPDNCDVCPDIDNSIDADGDTVPDCLDNPSVHNRTRGTDHFTIQGALNQAADGDLIEVDSGIYAVAQSIDFRGKAVHLCSTSGDPADTILNGQNSLKHIVQCVSSEGPDTVLSSFTITGGNANGSGANGNGGGMYNNNADPTVMHCIFNGNSARNNGGAMYNGGGSNPVVLYCTFSSNTTGAQGNAIFNANSDPTITHCLFSGNTGGNYGGGIYNVGSSPTLTHCLFSGNAAQVGGGGIADAGGNLTLAHCTFSANTADTGGGIYRISGSLTLTNSIVWGNTPNQVSGSIAASFCNIQGGLPTGSTDGGGNIDADPNFVDDDLHLLSGSPCIDAGDPNTIPADVFDLDGDGNRGEPIPLDLSGQVRLVDDLNTPDTGSGWPAVDMGAYEFQGCDGNLDAIAGVKLGDIAALANHWMQTDCGLCGGADFDGDHAVTMPDLMLQTTNWLCNTN